MQSVEVVTLLYYLECVPLSQVVPDSLTYRFHALMFCLPALEKTFEGDLTCIFSDTRKREGINSESSLVYILRYIQYCFNRRFSE